MLYQIRHGNRFGGGVWSNLCAAGATISRHGFLCAKFAPKFSDRESSVMRSLS